MTGRRALAFLALAGVLLALYAYPGDEGGARLYLFELYFTRYAQLVAGVLSWVEPEVLSQGSEIIGRGSLRIVKGCDAMDIMLPLAAAVLVTPAPWGARLRALALGLSALFALNVVRICSLYFVQIHRPELFETLHLELWPVLLMLTAAGGFFLWSRRFVARPLPSA